MDQQPAASNDVPHTPGPADFTDHARTVETLDNLATETARLAAVNGAHRAKSHQANRVITALIHEAKTAAALRRPMLIAEDELIRAAAYFHDAAHYDPNFLPWPRERQVRG